MLDSKIANFVDLLKFRAAQQPNKTAYIFLENGETEQARLTYQALHQQAEEVAAYISQHAAIGDRALLLYPPGLDFITAFFGCLYAGIIAVPAYPPRKNQSLERLRAIAQDAQATLALTTQKVLTDTRKSWQQDPLSSNLHWLATDSISDIQELSFKQSSSTRSLSEVEGDTIAFLQYTSGSTGTPKGVIVSHSNLFYNCATIYTCFENSIDHVGVSWLPFHHDMGLIGGVLQTVYGGGTVILMSPVAFLQKPIRWLQAISRYQAVTSGGPNFAYDLCAQTVRPEQLSALNLSTWSLAFTGAEPVRSETLERFTNTFSPCGFRHNTFYPCYGMAETTLLVTGGIRASEPVVYSVDSSALARNQIKESSIALENKALVGCGRTWLGQTVKIVDPDTLECCAQNRVGEIWVAGESVAKGYWKRPEQTQQTFQAYISDTSEGPFLRTGDLGFFKGEDLFITGRLKDVVIIRGRNHYPQDIELTAEEAHEALQLNSSAAFSVELNSAEQLVIVQEVKRPYLRGLNEQQAADEIILAIRRAVSETQELQVYAVVLLKPGSLPKTSSGKVQRKQCRRDFLNDELTAVAQWKRALKDSVPQPNQAFAVALDNLSQGEKVEAIKTWLINRMAQRLQIEPADISRQEPLASYGLDSLQVIEMSAELEAWLQRPVVPTIVYDYPTVEALAQRLAIAEDVATASPIRSLKGSDEAIAVVGMACRFPGAPNLQAFWNLLHEGQDAITEVPLSRWDTSQIKAASDRRTQWGGFLKQVDQFDPKFFGLSPREAAHMDPQQRLLLEVCWEALENAGLSAAELEGSYSGIFIGVSNGDYSRLQGSQLDKDVYYGTGNAFSIAANRLSYFLDWRGPSWAIDTACSSSLVAVHQACQNLKTGECDLALAGGVNLILDPQLTVTFSQAQMLAADGRCKTFDASADGYVRSEGCGVVALKRLSDATKDGDNIVGIIKGSAVNQDGRSNGLTAPNSLAQQAVVRQALATAGVSDRDISYIEAHGTGTSLGDPIEVNALRAVFTTKREDNQPCYLGSVKTNIGHLEPAAGVAGLIKVLLSLQHQKIPPHLHFQKINPYIQLEDTPLKIPTSSQDWPSDESSLSSMQTAKTRIAGISAFGFGGTNAHVIVSEPPQILQSQIAQQAAEHTIKDRPLHLLTLSAKSQESLEALVLRYQDFLQENSDLSLPNVCYTTNVGRSHFSHRLAVLASDTAQLPKKLKNNIGIARGERSNQKPPQIAFLFTGQGSQYINMGKALYDTQPTFRKAIDRCAEILASVNISLLDILSSKDIHQTAYTQPALFATEYALAQLWQSWGVEPSVVLGHSVGEYAAACIAGVFSLEDGLKLIAARGRLMQALPAGGEMLSVLATLEDAQTWIAPYQNKVSVAAINGPSSIVVSGEGEAVEAIARLLTQKGIKHQKLNVSHAFHSPLMEPMLADFEAIATQITYAPPNISFISCVTGQPVTNEIATPQYWIDHVQQPVDFAAGLSTLHRSECSIYLEIGPKPLLLGMGKQCLPPAKGQWLPSIRPENDWQQMLQTLGQLYISGLSIRWRSVDKGHSRYKVLLPTYPFQRQRYWSESKRTSLSATAIQHRKTAHPLTGQKIFSPVPPTQFQAQVGIQQPAYLTHHRVFGQAILPAAAYLEIAIASATAASIPNPILTNVSIQRGLILPESDTLTIQTVLTPADNNTQQFQVFSLVPTDSGADSSMEPSWICHAKGTIQTSEPITPPSVDLELEKANFLQQISTQSYYKVLHQQGLEYGDDFQAIQQLWAAPHQALGEIELPETLSSTPYQIHPVLLDASFQILAAAIGETQSQDIYLPAGVERLSLYGPIDNNLWALGSIAESSSEKQLIGDVKLLSASGKIVVHVEGLKLNRTNRDVLLRYLQPDVPPALYKMTWKKATLPQTPAPILSKRWLVFATASGVSKQAIEQLQNQGHTCIVVQNGTSYQQLDSQQYQINPSSPNDFQQLSEAVPSPHGIIYLWGTACTDFDMTQLLGCKSIFYLVGAFAKNRVSAPLWLVTQAAQQVQTESLQVHQSSIWGLGRVIALEHPELSCRCADISVDLGTVRQLVEEILSPSVENQIAYRGGDRYIARLTPYDETESGTLAIPSGESFQLKLTEYGLIDNLTLQETRRRSPAPKEVEIQVAAAGLNFRDVLNTLGLLKDYYAEHLGITHASQLTFGFECAGTVVAVGEEVAGLKIDDDVIATMLTDGVSRFVTTRSEFVIPKPKNITFAEAATLPLAFLTAYYGLHYLANLKAGDKVLIHAAAGGVGQAAVQIAQKADAEIFATASLSKWDFLKRQGIHHVMNSRTLAFADNIMVLTNGKGVDVVLNSLNGDFIDKSFEAIAPNGRFVELGKIGIWDKQKVKHNHPNVQYFPFDLGEVTKADPALIHDVWHELSDRFIQNDFHPLPIKTFSIQQTTQAFRHIQQAKHIGKVVLTLPNTQPSDVSINGNSCYLITGGLGALGLQVAQWIVTQGGRYIALTGRRAPTDSAQIAIKQLEDSGANISILLGDISVQEDVENIFEQLAELPALKGIIHAAGVLEDGLLSQLTWPQFKKVLAPKVDGTWHLHQQTQRLSLDFFVCFSSIASLIGSPAQGNYAAANAFMDSLMQHRRATGLPGLSINWGPWANAGMAAQLDTSAQNRMSARGITPIQPEQGLQILGDLLKQTSAQAGVFSIDWPKFNAQMPPGVSLPVLEHFKTAKREDARGDRLQGLEKLKQLPAGDRRHHLMQHIQTEIADVLGYDSPDDIALTQPLADLGVDSLMAVELANQLEYNLGPTIPASFLFEHPTLEGLVNYLIEQMPSIEFEEGET